MRRTKIIATLSDFKAEEPNLTKQYIEAGADVIRINSAHVDFNGASSIIDSVRAASKDVAILLDTKGPEIRTHNVQEPIVVEQNDTVYIKNFTEDSVSKGKVLHTSYPKIVEDIEVGASVLIDDGYIHLIVEGKTKDSLVCIAQNKGAIKNRKSVNIPNNRIDLPALTEKDKKFIVFAIEQKLDFIAHSFVRCKEDVIAIQEILDKHNSPIKIISKIEDKEGVDNINEILEVSHGIMIARGDLAIEIPSETVPVVSRQLIKTCIKKGRTVIMATQMLHTMIDEPRPTRAEVSDVSSAIFYGVDAIMLSGETANGKYGKEAIAQMDRIAASVEEHASSRIELVEVPEHDISLFLAKSAIRGAEKLHIKAIVSDSTSGQMPQYLASFRPKYPIYAQCYKEHLVRQLRLSYGVFPFYVSELLPRPEYLKKTFERLFNENCITKSDLVAILGGRTGIGKGTTLLEFQTMDHVYDVF